MLLNLTPMLNLIRMPLMMPMLVKMLRLMMMTLMSNQLKLRFLNQFILNQRSLS
ncbi:hypothetical protein S245_013215, partial [Arachis hypogaea]